MLKNNSSLEVINKNIVVEFDYDGKHSVIDQTNPEENYNVEQPDSPVFIDIYEKSED